VSLEHQNAKEKEELYKILPNSILCGCDSWVRMRKVINNMQDDEIKA
jgi:hypothetical protein